jgi:hypothetical protein
MTMGVEREAGIVRWRWLWNNGYGKEVGLWREGLAMCGKKDAIWAQDNMERVSCAVL